MDIIEELEKLRRKHHYCEDTFYSCPKNDSDGEPEEDAECDCGADHVNEILDKIIAYLKERENVPD